jgi:type IV pilus assembly protein PilE
MAYAVQKQDIQGLNSMIFFHGRPRHRSRGFTLTELLIILVILGLLAAFGLPAFLNYARQSRLAVAQTKLKQIGGQETQWFSAHKAYATLRQLGYPVDSAISAIYLDKDGLISDSASKDTIYRISIALGAPTTAASPTSGEGDPGAYYLLTAEPVNGQIKDTRCGVLSLASTGQVGATGLQGENACWAK